MMQFLSPPERSIRDSAHALDIYLAVHTKIPLKYKFGTCWSFVLWEFDGSKFNIRKKEELLSQKKSSKTAFTGGVKSEFILQVYCLNYTIKARPCMIINLDEC